MAALSAFAYENKNTVLPTQTQHAAAVMLRQRAPPVDALTDGAAEVTMTQNAIADGFKYPDERGGGLYLSVRHLCARIRPPMRTGS
jgi:hypothetical protein